MNFQSTPLLKPLRVLVINPLSTAGQMSILKILSGSIFGINQLINLILVVYENEIPEAQDMKNELLSCGSLFTNSIVISSDLPKISDADVFCFLTNLANPNSLNFRDINSKQFDALYLIIKIANGLAKPPPNTTSTPKEKTNTKEYEENIYKPIIMADGVVTINILSYFTKDNSNIPRDIFFCPTPLPTIAKSVLGDYFKLPTNVINDVRVWAADDQIFFVKVDKPIITYDKLENDTDCDWDGMGKEVADSLNLDHIQFNASWMKKEFVEKVGVIASKNPYGPIYRASAFANTLKIICKARLADESTKTYASVGIISDGSLETMKGSAYVLPLILSGDTWTVSKASIESSHLQQEMNRINKAVLKVKDELITYCKRFLQTNIINQAFIPSSNEFSSDTSKTSSSTDSACSVESTTRPVTLQLSKQKLFI